MLANNMHNIFSYFQQSEYMYDFSLRLSFETLEPQYQWHFHFCSYHKLRFFVCKFLAIIGPAILFTEGRTYALLNEFCGFWLPYILVAK